MGGNEAFNRVDTNNDKMIFIEELNNASSEIKKKIAEEFDKKYNIEFGKEHGISEEEFNEFLGGNKKKEEKIFYNRDKRGYQASLEQNITRQPNSQVDSNLHGVGSLYNTVQEMNFYENLKKSSVSVILDSNINQLINSINQKSQERGGGSGISSIGKHGKIKIGTYSQNGTIGIVEIEYFESDKKLLLNGNLVFNFGGDGLDINTLNKVIDNIGKEIVYKAIPETPEGRLNMIRIQQIEAENK